MENNLTAAGEQHFHDVSSEFNLSIEAPQFKQRDPNPEPGLVSGDPLVFACPCRSNCKIKHEALISALQLQEVNHFVGLSRPSALLCTWNRASLDGSDSLTGKQMSRLQSSGSLRSSPQPARPATTRHQTLSLLCHFVLVPEMSNMLSCLESAN